MEGNGDCFVPAIMNHSEPREQTYADHCLCQSCCNARTNQTTDSVPTSPTTIGLEGLTSNCTSPERNQEEDTEDDENQATETEEEHTSGYELARVQSTHSLLASDPAVSKRPFVCPMKSCRRHVAVNNLLCHFRFEHPEIERVDLNQEFPTLKVKIPPLHKLAPMTTEFAAILRIAWEDEDKELVPDKWKLVLAYAVMEDGGFLAWVFGLLDGDQTIIAKLTMEQEASWFPDLSGENELTVDAEKISPPSPFIYKVRSLSFLGPVLPLRESQEPLDILSKGDCLYIPAGLVGSLCSTPEGMILQLTVGL